MIEKIQIFKAKIQTKILGISLIIICLLLLYVLITGWNIDRQVDLYYVIGLFTFFLLGLIFIGYPSLKYQLILSETSIIEKKAYGKDTQLNFNEIESSTLLLGSTRLILKGNHKIISLTNTIANVDQAIEFITTKIGKEKINFQ